MAFKTTYEKHAYFFPSNMLATNYAKHLLNVEISKDYDNGSIVTKGDWLDLNLYKDGSDAVTTTAVIRQEANTAGQWYVEVTSAGNGVILYKEPIIEDAHSFEARDILNFYNAKGDVVKGYTLADGDIFEINETLIDGTAKAGAELTVANGKWKVAPGH